MAHHKDAIKRARQNEERRIRNKHYKSRMRNQIKTLRSAIQDGNTEKARDILPKTVSIIQRLAQKGIIHKRNAARKVSRLTRAVNAMQNQAH